MSLKNNYIKLSEKFGGPYTLIKKGIKRGIISSIMRGSIPKANEALEMARVLGVTRSDVQIVSGAYIYDSLGFNKMTTNDYIYKREMFPAVTSGFCGYFPIQF